MNSHILPVGSKLFQDFELKNKQQQQIQLWPHLVKLKTHTSHDAAIRLLGVETLTYSRVGNLFP